MLLSSHIHWQNGLLSGSAAITQVLSMAVVVCVWGGEAVQSPSGAVAHPHKMGPMAEALG